MHRRTRWLILSALAVFSLAIYVAQFQLFHKRADTLFYFFQDLAFLPISVIFVTFIIDALISSREKRMTMQKMNLVIGTFYSELGRKLLGSIREFDGNFPELQKNCSEIVSTEPGLKALGARAAGHTFSIRITDREKLAELRQLLSGKRDFLVRLLENQSLLEHETFTGLIMAVFHLTEELTERLQADALSDADIQHLEADILRVYAAILPDWVRYLKHLSKHYPFLFRFATATNPLK